VVAAAVEEGFKFLVLWFYSARHDAFDEPMDGIVYGVAASLGFAALENVGYVLATDLLGAGASTAAARAVTAVPAHAAFGVLMGACIGVAKFAGHRQRFWLLLGLAGAIGLHGLYNFGLFSAQAMYAQGSDSAAGLFLLVTIGTLLASVVASALALARMRRDQRLSMEAALRLQDSVVEAPMDRSESADKLDELPMLDEAESRTRQERLLAEGPTPVLPMVALVATAASVLAWLVAIVLLVAAESSNPEAFQPESEEVPPAGWIGGLLVLAGALGGAIGALLGLVSLVVERRWKPLSIVSLVVGGLMVGFVLLMTVLGIAFS
jgi:hypothetical protein